MARDTREEIRNLAIIAHVDHGKTTLLDAMLWQSALSRDGEGVAGDPAAMLDPEREKRIRIMPRVTSIPFRGTRINLMDTPGHAHFGREAERVLRIVDGVMFLVDACEGPPAATRLVLHRAFERGLAPIVVINKIDKPEARPAAVLEEIRDLFLDLDASEEQREFPVLYSNALRGTCRVDAQGRDESLLLLFDKILETVPAPRHDPDGPLQFLVSLLDYDDYLGRLALGRVFRGRLAKGQTVARCRLDGAVETCTTTGLIGYDGPRHVEIDGAGRGEIVAVTGLEGVSIGETLSDPEHPSPLAPVKPEEATLSMVLSVNDSPMAGLEGQFVSGASLRERLWSEILTNASIQVRDTGSASAFELMGRDELQMAILIEMMRREGYELQVSTPQVVTREENGRRLEPMESLVIDCPEEFVAVVTEKVAARRGKMTKMVNHGAGRVRMGFRISSRGLIGMRTEFLNDTKGTGFMNHAFEEFDEWQGAISRRTSGALVADRPGRATAYAMEHLQPRGTVFVAPGDQVYEGMIVGENSRSNDLRVNVTKTKQPADSAGSALDPPARLIPPRSMSLEQALEFIRDDELVEVTPRAIRLRKKALGSSAPRT